MFLQTMVALVSKKHGGKNAASTCYLTCIPCFSTRRNKSFSTKKEQKIHKHEQIKCTERYCSTMTRFYRNLHLKKLVKLILFPIDKASCFTLQSQLYTIVQCNANTNMKTIVSFIVWFISNLSMLDKQIASNQKWLFWKFIKRLCFLLNLKAHVHPVNIARLCFCSETVPLLNARFWMNVTFTGPFAHFIVSRWHLVCFQPLVDQWRFSDFPFMRKSAQRALLFGWIWTFKTLPGGRSVWEKTVPEVLSTYSRPRAQFFPIRTDLAR